LGFFLAPLMPCLLIIVVSIFNRGSGIEFWILLLLPISYVVSLFVGGPTYWLLSRFGKTGALHYVFAGTFASLLPILYVFFYGELKSGRWSTMFDGIMGIHYAIMGFMIAVGVVISTTFWFIARPDRRGSPEPSASEVS
jgi:hypothetical protein